MRCQMQVYTLHSAIHMLPTVVVHHSHIHIVKGAKLTRCVSAHDVAQREQLAGEETPWIRQLTEVPSTLCVCNG